MSRVIVRQSQIYTTLARFSIKILNFNGVFHPVYYIQKFSRGSAHKITQTDPFSICIAIEMGKMLPIILTKIEKKLKISINPAKNTKNHLKNAFSSTTKEHEVFKRSEYFMSYFPVKI
jgi:hypothetical protein